MEAKKVNRVDEECRDGLETSKDIWKDDPTAKSIGPLLGLGGKFPAAPTLSCCCCFHLPLLRLFLGSKLQQHTTVFSNLPRKTLRQSTAGHDANDLSPKCASACCLLHCLICTLSHSHNQVALVLSTNGKGGESWPIDLKSGLCGNRVLLYNAHSQHPSILVFFILVVEDRQSALLCTETTTQQCTVVRRRLSVGGRNIG